MTTPWMRLFDFSSDFLQTAPNRLGGYLAPFLRGPGTFNFPETEHAYARLRVRACSGRAGTERGVGAGGP